MSLVQAIPPLNPLRVFDVAARLESFTEAAAELGVTQSAVSRQIATLEAALDAQLFVRERHGVRLTKEGRTYRDAIAPAFTMIRAASAALKNRRAEPLRLRIYTTFAAKWLIKRLPKFQELHPKISVKLDASVENVNFARDDIDLAIQFGRGDWRGVEKQLLIRDVIQPVCSPKFLQKHPELRSINGLRGKPLLHSHYRRKDWTDWLVSVDRSDLLTEGTLYPNSMLAYEAATEGIGISMGQTLLLKDDIAAGTLVPLFDRPLTRPLAYFAIWRKSAVQNRKVTSFMRWVTQEIGRS
jgi:LysR family transcriptional regulator, glycine cleavage system transcriptional activator